MIAPPSVIVPAILSGGSGTRILPMSRPEKPKRRLSLIQVETMLQLQVRQAEQHLGFAPPLIVADALLSGKMVSRRPDPDYPLT